MFSSIRLGKYLKGACSISTVVGQFNQPDVDIHAE